MSVENFTYKAGQYIKRHEENWVRTIPNGIEAPGLTHVQRLKQYKV